MNIDVRKIFAYIAAVVVVVCLSFRENKKQKQKQIVNANAYAVPGIESTKFSGWSGTKWCTQ